MTSPDCPAGLNRGELARYAGRVGERWPLERAVLGGARVADLWDASEMGARADVHCYTPVELDRKVASLRVVREAVGEGVDLLAASRQ